jgi:DNA polymerase-3 subunit delta'
MLAPQENLTLFGHQNGRESFLKAFHSSRFSHAWIVNGPFGIGKTTFSFHMARYILSGREDGNTVFSDKDPLYRRIAASSHGDLWTIGLNEDKEIGVESVRELNRFLNQTSAEGGWRVIIIKGADKLNRNAANALLKRLEEPPHKTVFFLITTLSARLMPTLRSRCQFLNLTPLNAKEVQQVFSSQNLTLPEIIPLSEGSPGRIRELMEEGMELYADLQEVLKGGESASYIHTYGGEDKSHELIEALLRDFLHAQLLAKVQDKPSFFTQVSLDYALKVCERIDKLFDQCRRAQLDRKTTLTCIFATLENKQ